MYIDALEFVKSGGIAILDRSFLGNKVFAEVQRNAGNISEEEFKIYESVFRDIRDFPDPDYIVYLMVDPRMNVVRCNRRNRSTEASSYTLDYFQSLNDTYDDVMAEMDDTQNIIRLDWTEELPTDELQLNGAHWVLNSLRDNFKSV